MKKLFSTLVIIITTVSTAYAGKESALAASIDRRDEKGFAVALKNEQSEQELAEALRNAAGNENKKYLIEIIKHKKQAAKLIKTDSSIFLTALSDGRLKNVQILEKIASVAALKFEKNTNALQQAIQVSNLEIIQHLANKYPSLALEVDDQGESILFHAVRRGDREIVAAVMKIKNLPSVNVNKKGQTAQALAKELGYLRIAEMVK